MPSPNPFSRLILAVSLAAAATAGTLASHAVAAGMTPQAAIDARKANFKKMGTAMKAIVEQVKGGTLDHAVIGTNAKIIASTMPQQANLFPKGSGPESGLKTSALPEIWTTRATFDDDAKKLVVEADKLAALAGGSDNAAIAAQVKTMGEQCGNCHRQFRHKD